MFDVIALDWGSKRFGMAFGASSNGLILACNYDCFNPDLFEILNKEILARKTKRLVIGMPSTFDFKKTEVSISIDLFVVEFKSKYPDIEIEIVNERNSTKKALEKNYSLKTHKLNHQAAAEILTDSELFLEK
jgi:RNase H-fold protein (predicted Holliday junction resolvase)